MDILDVGSGFKIQVGKVTRLDHFFSKNDGWTESKMAKVEALVNDIMREDARQREISFERSKEFFL